MITVMVCDIVTCEEGGSNEEVEGGVGNECMCFEGMGVG